MTTRLACLFVVSFFPEASNHIWQDGPPATWRASNLATPKLFYKNKRNSFDDMLSQYSWQLTTPFRHLFPTIEPPWQKNVSWENEEWYREESARILWEELRDVAEAAGAFDNNLCPSGGEPSVNHCSGSKNSSAHHPDTGNVSLLCSEGSLCFRGMEINGERIHRCCGNLNNFCPGTGLHAWHSSDRLAEYLNTFLYGFIPSLEKTEWYRRNYKEAGRLGVACPIPYSFTLKQKDEYLYSPVGWNYNRKMAERDKSFWQKRCLTNSECDEGNFCDAVWNPTYSTSFYLDRSDNGKPVWFCFELPSLPKKLKHVEFDKGMKICNSHTDCNDPNQICHETQGVSYGNVSSPSTRAPGICVHVDACNANDTEIRGALNVNNQLCTDDKSCEGAGISKGTSEYSAYCREFFGSESNRSLCCYKKKPDCRLGKNVTPRKVCSTMTDCTGDLKKNPWNTWCDETGVNICCEDLDNSIWRCPDLATPLFNEPLCNGSTINNKTSGKCPIDSGICHYGHCCPPLIVTANGTNVTLGERRYQTRFPCNVSLPVPRSFSYAFCNPENSMLVIMGQFHDNGDNMTTVSGKKCILNDDCSVDGSSFCVHENDGVHSCYYNPFRPLPPLHPNASNMWKIVFIVSLVVLIISIICFVYYRWKCVLGKRNKFEGAGGDGGKPPISRP